MHQWEKSIIINDVRLLCMGAEANIQADQPTEPTDPLARLGAKIARKRKERGLNQEEFVGLLNRTRYRPDITRQSHISNIENSTSLPSLRLLAAAAEVLETNMDWLADLSNDDKPASDLEDQLVVAVRDEDERALLQELFDLIHARPSEEQRFIADVVRRLAAPPAPRSRPTKPPVIIGGVDDKRR